MTTLLIIKYLRLALALWGVRALRALAVALEAACMLWDRLIAWLTDRAYDLAHWADSHAHYRRWLIDMDQKGNSAPLKRYRRRRRARIERRLTFWKTS